MKKFILEEDGATFAEYAILLSLITVAIVLALNTFQGQVTTAISNSTTMIPTG